MAAGRRYREILAALLPAGALGASILLGSAASGATTEEPAGSPAVAERLAAIRDAVSDLSTPAGSTAAPAAERLAWGNWGNGGIGIGGFGIGIDVPTWNNWGNGWRNWKNAWSNGWNNWSNGWHNY